MPIRNEQGESNVPFIPSYTTEQIHVEEQIEQLLNTLEQQLSSIEMAHTLLAQLTTELSHADIASQFKGLDALTNTGNNPIYDEAPPVEKVTLRYESAQALSAAKIQELDHTRIGRDESQDKSWASSKSPDDDRAFRPARWRHPLLGTKRASGTFFDPPATRSPQV